MPPLTPSSPPCATPSLRSPCRLAPQTRHDADEGSPRTPHVPQTQSPITASSLSAPLADGAPVAAPAAPPPGATVAAAARASFCARRMSAARRMPPPTGMRASPDACDPRGASVGPCR
ncbi:unnamed protein product [Ectocarpus sp. 8 AP-2014]